MAYNCYANRELSWLKFNERVLEEAADEQVPFAERLSFISIFQSNLDEFFMVRVGSLHDRMMVSKEDRDNKTNMTCKEQIDAILKDVHEMSQKKDRIYESLMKKAETEGISLVNFASLTMEEAEYMEQYFNNEIKPLLSPQVIGKKQPFPFLKNREIYAVVVLRTARNNEKLGIVPCSNEVFKRLIPVPSESRRFMLVEELILHFAPQIFESYSVKSKSLIRIIRNADIDADEASYDEDLDYRDIMSELIRKRRKLCPVKLEFSRTINENIIGIICDYLEIDVNQAFYSSAPLDLSFVSIIRDLLREKKELFYERRIPQKSPFIDEERSIIEQIKEKDKLLSYPYESMKPFLKLLEEAGQDPDVVSIKMTLYRVARMSKVVELLIDAAENGKEVIVLVELRARFDEENNIEWSRRLEDAGCRIIYGLDKLKVHSKLCLITRKGENQVEYITQIGTGNYNEKTAKLYTDLSLMTSSIDIGIETARIFNALALGKVVESSQKLLVAPKCLQNKVVDMIDEEIAAAKNGEDAYIGLKLNSLTDKVIIDKLIEASKAGVRIEMIIRGICCIVAGIPGETENIRVISIVGRFLEHSRIYIFGTAVRRKIYIASADFMTRNTTRRVEVAVPILDEDIKVRILELFTTMLSDGVKAREQKPDGTYEKITVKEGEAAFNSQELLFQQSYDNVNGIAE
ncbi:MAG: polyphosphate kinase 1 [Thermoflexaceae bacterium]|nr:polyphosphate kinase 1 [Thermoflexaceae bacterium]